MQPARWRDGDGGFKRIGIDAFVLEKIFQPVGSGLAVEIDDDNASRNRPRYFSVRPPLPQCEDQIRIGRCILDAVLCQRLLVRPDGEDGHSRRDIGESPIGSGRRRWWRKVEGDHFSPFHPALSLAPSVPPAWARSWQPSQIEISSKSSSAPTWS